MLALTPNANNTITVTWFQRAGAGSRYQLVIQHLSTNTTTIITLLKSANTSSYRLRYDRFTFALASIPTGQFRYTVYDTDSTYLAAVAVVENGIGIVETTPLTMQKYAGAPTYGVYNGAGIFDPTFDNSFN
jgi:hypothetical protein